MQLCWHAAAAQGRDGCSASLWSWLPFDGAGTFGTSKWRDGMSSRYPPTLQAGTTSIAGSFLDTTFPWDWTVGPCLAALTFPFRQVCRVNAQRLGMGSALFTRFGLKTSCDFSLGLIIVTSSLQGFKATFVAFFATHINHFWIMGCFLGMFREMLWVAAVWGHQSSRTPADLTAIRWKMAKS